MFGNTQTNEKTSDDISLKKELLNLICLNNVKHDILFSDTIVYKCFEKLNYDPKFIESLPLSRNSVVRRTDQLEIFVESAII